MSYNIKTFIKHAQDNGEFISLRKEGQDYSDSDLYKEFPAEFARMFMSDKCVFKEFPIIVWEYKRKPVAFWDCTNITGYILT